VLTLEQHIFARTLVAVQQQSWMEPLELFLQHFNNSIPLSPGAPAAYWRVPVAYMCVLSAR
jgi:hypothetical protein